MRWDVFRECENMCLDIRTHTTHSTRSLRNKKLDSVHSHGNQIFNFYRLRVAVSYRTMEIYGPQIS